MFFLAKQENLITINIFTSSLSGSFIGSAFYCVTTWWCNFYLSPQDGVCERTVLYTFELITVCPLCLMWLASLTPLLKMRSSLYVMLHSSQFTTWFNWETWAVIDYWWLYGDTECILSDCVHCLIVMFLLSWMK